jgi:hypothetical protein
LEFFHTDRVLSYSDFLVNMSASADVLAQAKVEIALGSIPEGKNVRRTLGNSPSPSRPMIPNIRLSYPGYHQVAW